MRKLIVTGCCLVLLAALSGCENTRRTLGMGKQAPDEFAVLTRAPLELPPDYGLRPPAPGAQRPQEATTRAQARRILLGAASADKAARPGATFSRGETAILKRAGALNPDPTIRRKVNRESTSIADAEAGFLDRIIFWQRPDAPGLVVDADKESRRLREASAMGTAPNKTDVPVIRRKERGFLEGIF